MSDMVLMNDDQNWGRFLMDGIQVRVDLLGHAKIRTRYKRNFTRLKLRVLLLPNRGRGVAVEHVAFAFQTGGVPPF